MRILACTRKEWVGVKTSILSFCSLIKENYRECEIYYFDIPDGSGLSNTVFKEIVGNPPDLLIIGGWDVGVKNIIQNVNRGKTKVLLNWCSPIAQIELGGEMNLFRDVLIFIKLGMIDKVTMLLEKDADILNKTQNNFVYFPVVLNTNEMNENIIEKTPNNGNLKCDLFCLPNPRKNILIQMLALSSFDDIDVYTNYAENSIYKKMCEILLKSYFNLNFISNRRDYLRTIQGMTFASQVSFSEGFNYTVAEHFFYKIPVVCSTAIPFVRNVNELKDFVICNASDSNEIDRKTRNMVEICKKESEYIDLGTFISELIQKESLKNEMILLDLFKKVME